MNEIYVVLTVNLIVWVGVFVYLLSIERRLKRIEKQ